MESVGARLRHTRESHGYTIEQVARDTHIAKRFIDALENEDFSAFPGDPYLIGFMRTYSDYLGLNPQETIQLYHNMQLQEQPPPIEELIAPRHQLPVGRILIVAVAIAAVVGIGYLAVTSDVFVRQPEDATPVAEQPSTPVGRTHRMVEQIVEQRFALGDRIVVPVLDVDYTVTIAAIGQSLTLRYGDAERAIGADQDAVLDLTQDGRADLRVVVRRLETQETPPTAVLRFDRGGVPAAAAVVDDGAVQDSGLPDLGATSIPAREAQARLITQATTAAPFTIQINFVGNTMVRYQLDSAPRVEQYHQSGQSISVTAQRQIKLWVSNAGSTRLQVAGQDVPLGGPGQVTAALIAWVPGQQTGDQLLQIFPVY
ncbi:MAG: helix-turn-helix domain-containing protein [Spirochaetaceae bacterium]|nr:MAG: helix-turn-helix domain-containing protein [Spirochaetaceae bacterium]